MAAFPNRILSKIKNAILSLGSALAPSTAGADVTKSDEWYNILLIGQTGSGKTSFLDLLGFMHAIEQDGGWEAALEKRKMLHSPTLENSEEMESGTNASSYYKIKFGEVQLGIVDTPGFGDTRGLEKDKENVKNIVEKVNQVEYIHAICLIINGTEARMSPQLRYVASEISAILPKATVSNMVIIFTRVCNKSRASFKLSKLAEFLGREIQESRAFYIDNPYSILQNDSSFIPQDIEKEFDAASTVFAAITNELARFKKIYSTVFMNLYMTKVAVERTTSELVVQVQYQDELKAKSLKAKQDIDVAIKTRKALCKTAIETAWERKHTDTHNTLCATCHSNCHSPCRLKKTFDKEVLKNCAAMRSRQTECSVCGHAYDLHYHDNVIFIQESKELISDVGIKQFNEEREITARSVLGSKLKKEIDEKLKDCESFTSEICKELLNKVDFFEGIASTPNYITLLRNQLNVIERCIEAPGTKGPSVADLKGMHTELTTKLNVVQENLKPYIHFREPLNMK